MLESLIVFVLTVALVGFLVYLVTTYVRMAQPFRDVIVGVSVAVLVLWIVAVLLGYAALPTLPRFR